MNFSVDERIFTTFDNPRIALIVARGVDNKGENSEIRNLLDEVVDKMKSDFQNATISQLPKIAAWREAYRQFGAKAKDYPSSVESLYKRVVNGNVGSISPLVDLYNSISLKYMLPVGGEDLDKMHGDLRLTFAGNDEKPVLVVGRDEGQVPPAGEVVYRDDEDIICRRWNWREAARTMLMPSTRNAIFVIEALGVVGDAELMVAQKELGEAIKKYCGGDVRYYWIDQGNPARELDF